MNFFRPIILLLFLVSVALPWGRVGHETIAYIAEKNLNPATMAKLKPLLAGETLESISTWADEIRPQKRYTAPWHFIDLPVRENVTSTNWNQFIRGDNNIDRQIEKDIRELRNQNTSLNEKQEALKFLVHFIGDATMPLHCADDNDRGGNEKQVRFFSPDSRSNKGHVTNLHSLWDNLIEIKAAEDPQILGNQLNQEITSAEKSEWEKGTTIDWILDSYRIAKTIIYNGMPLGNGFVKLPPDYYSRMRPIVNKQLEKGGIRLAWILEEIFNGR
jgi:hypothetical protein